MADSNTYKQFLSKIFQGGLQPYMARDEGQIYMRNLMNDCVQYCLRDVAAGSPRNLSDEERECAKNYLTKNFVLMNERLN